MSKHAPFSPSGLKRKALCPASHTAEQKYSDVSSVSAIEGTHTHTLNETAAKANLPASAYVGSELTDHEGTFIVSQDQAERSQVFLDFVDQYKKQNNDVNPFYWEIEYEKQVNPGMLIFRTDWYGTADLTLIQYQHGDPNKVPVGIVVADYKDGGMPVDPYENYQGISYMLGVLASFPLQLTENTPVTFAIIQPKCGGHKSWTTTVGKLYNIYLPVLIKAIQDCEVPDPKFNPGDEQCQFCKHKRWCDARKNMALETASMAFSTNPDSGQELQLSPQLPVIGAMTNEQLSKVLIATPIAKGWLNDAYEEAMERHQAGNLIPDHKLIQKSGRRSWIEDTDLIIKTLTKGFTADKKPIWGKRDVIKESPISFKQILSNPKLNDKQKQRIESELIKKTKGKQELVHISAKGEDISPATAFAKADIT